jgi:hypothetical protein
MIDILIDTIESGVYQELGSGSAYYVDHFITATTNKALNVGSPNAVVAVIEDTSSPINFEIASRHSPTVEEYRIKIQTVHKGFNEAKVKEERRLIIKRLKMCFWRQNGNMFTSLLTLVDSGVGYREAVRKYSLGTTMYETTEINSEYYYASETELIVETETNFSV